MPSRHVSTPASLPADRSKLRPSRAHLSSATVVLAMAAMIWLAITKMNIGAAAGAMSNASLLWAAVAVAAVAAAFFARAESWFLAVRAAMPQTPPSRAVVARSLAIGVATSSVTPARVGEAVRTWVLSRRTDACCATILGTVVSQTMMNGLGLGLLGIFVLSGSSAFGFSPVTIAAAIAVPLLLFGAAAAAGRLVMSSCPGGDPGIDPSLIKRVGCWVSRQVAGTGKGMAVFTCRVSAVRSTGAQIGAWVMQGVACYAIMAALGIHATPIAAGAVLLAVNVSAVVPVTPANVGIFQAACIAVLTPLGVHSGDALAYGLLLQAVEIAVALAMGVPALLGEGLTLRDLGQARSGMSLAAAAAA